MADFLSSIWPYAAAVLVILGAAVLIALIVVLVRAAKSMKHINTITEEAEREVTPALKRVDPLVDRAELTVDTLNLELLRVDAILEDVENVTDVAGKTADTVNTITSAPSNAVAALAERVHDAFGSKRKKAKKDRFVYPIGAGAKKPEPAGDDVTSAASAIASDEPSEEDSAVAASEQDAAEDAPATEDAATSEEAASSPEAPASEGKEDSTAQDAPAEQGE
ncbi:MAG: hypothetical protein ACOX69_01940 [Coriobacteriales bacterium]|jgi:uncharacterized protein YoxC